VNEKAGQVRQDNEEFQFMISGLVKNSSGGYTKQTDAYLSLAKIQNAVEMKSMRSRLYHSYEKGIQRSAEFWRTTGITLRLLGGST
jgi:hypothetical protein